MAKQLLIRESAQLELQDDGRTAIGRLIPYNTVTDIVDPRTGDIYKETFLHRAFEGALKNPDRIDLRYSHDGGLDNVLGQGLELEEREDGLYGAFRLYESVATRAREVLKGHAKFLSVGFYPIKSRRKDGVVQRVKAYLEHVAATPTPAYVGAEILAIREGLAVEEEVPPEAPTLDSVQEWLQSRQHPAGFTPPPDTNNIEDVQKYLAQRQRFAASRDLI